MGMWRAGAVALGLIAAGTTGGAEDMYPIIIEAYPEYDTISGLIRLDERDGTYRDPRYGDRYDGYARITFSTRIRCECTFRNGSPHDGTLIYPDGTIYVGLLAANRPNGTGEIRYPDGSEYEGEFFRGLPHGEGRLREADRSTYRGTFRNGLPYRDISYLSSDMSVSYDGDFENGVPSYGLIAIINDTYGRTISFGSFTRGGDDEFALLLTGEGGILSFRRGELHGNFQSTGLEGFGLDLYWTDGSVYAGPYRAGKRDGQVGSLALPNGVSSLLREGTRIVGRFEDGVLQGEVTIVARDGRKTEALMIDGQLVDFAKVDVFQGRFEDGELVEITSDRVSAPNYYESPAAVIETGAETYRLSQDSVAQLEYLVEKMEEGEILKNAGIVAPWLKLWADLPPKPYRPSIIGMTAEAGAPAINLAFVPSEWDAYPGFLRQIDNVVKARLRGIIQYNILHHQLTRGDDRRFWTDLLTELELGPSR
ncbi:hypothetical protein [Yoonia sp.]|uniref:hypothetical protein n=1 Tax=Yoonia sp. TaxID=2212373 RepID=UPI00358EBF9C